MPLTQYPEWEYYSHKLSKEETENPLMVIAELFDFAHLPDVRNMLWLWLKTTVSGDFSESLDYLERSSILSLFEKVEKLVEAAHLIHVTHKQQSQNDA